MKSTPDNPLGFLEWYLEHQLLIDLQNFYQGDNDFAIEDGLIKIEKVDKENHIVHYQNFAVDGVDDYFQKNFHNILKKKLQMEVQNSIQILESEIQKRFSDKKEVRAYTDFLRIKIRHIESFASIKKFPLLKDYINQINETINRYSVEVKQYGFIPSFSLLAENELDQKRKIETLYNLLVLAPSMIYSTKKEFVCAFTGKEVVDGVHWLITGKNKNISKISLFYFLEELINEKHLPKSIIPDLNKYVLYVFRDNKGAELKNLKQSKSFVTKNPTQKDRIDTIISSL